MIIKKYFKLAKLKYKENIFYFSYILIIYINIIKILIKNYLLFLLFAIHVVFKFYLTIPNPHLKSKQ